MIQAKDNMTTKLLVVTLGTSFKDALTFMSRDIFRHLPVVNELNNIVGIVSQRDLVGCPEPESANDSVVRNPLLMSPICSIAKKNKINHYPKYLNYRRSSMSHQLFSK